MRLIAIFNLLKECIFVAVIIILIMIISFYIGYFLINKKTFKFNKSHNIGKVCLYSVFIVYLITVLGATLATRPPIYISNFNFHIFSSYIEAWNSFSKQEWINLILNILMFVPLGILLPLLFNKCKNFKITYILGLLCSLALEIIQLITKRGIFEIDDIINNTTGCMIGYGIISIYIYFHKKKSIFYAQIPLIITLIAYVTIFQIYNSQELGNLSIKHSYARSMSDLYVSTNINFNDSRDKTYTYNTLIGTEEDTLNTAKDIFNVVNTNVDESAINAYYDTVIYESINKEHSIWVNFKGLTWNYTNYNKMSSNQDNSLTYEEVKQALSIFNVSLPKNPDFHYKDGHGYVISAFENTDDDKLLYGTSSCHISDDGMVSGFDNGIISYNKYKEYDIISEKEAYDKITNGEFKGYLPEGTSELNITNVKLSYKMDSKGFLQPVYEFTINDVGNTLQIPAIA